MSTDEEARKLGEVLGNPEIINLGVLANRFTPELRTHDRFGYRIDEVAYHPAYHDLMRVGIKAQTHSLPWTEKRSRERMLRGRLWPSFGIGIGHEGTGWPLTMTFAAIPLRFEYSLNSQRNGNRACVRQAFMILDR